MDPQNVEDLASYIAPVQASETLLLSNTVDICFLFASDLRCSPDTAVTIYVWTDRQPSRIPRAVLQRGRCDRDECAQFSISISNGETGITVRFDSEGEFRQFLEQGELAAGRFDSSS